MRLEELTSRRELPQIDSIGAFVKSLSDSYIECKREKVLVTDLKPSQSEFDIKKVRDIIKKGIVNNLWICDKDYRIIDGHHRWMALKEVDPFAMVTVYRIMVSNSDLVSLGRNFYGSKIHEEFKKIDSLEPVIAAAKKYPNRHIMWRGIKDVDGTIVYVTGRGRNYRNSNKGSEIIMNKLGIKNPAFATWDENKAAFFADGEQPYIFVPIEPYTLWQSDKVEDISTWAKREIWTEKELKNKIIRKHIDNRSKSEIKELAEFGAMTYKKTDEFDFGEEIVADAKEYFLIDPHILSKKYIKTYSDIYE